MSEMEICENVQTEITQLMLDMDRLRAENMALKEDIEHYHKYEDLIFDIRLTSLNIGPDNKMGFE